MAGLTRNYLAFIFIPLILSIGITSSVSFFDLIQEADAQTKAVGPKAARSYGSKTSMIVCGDRLCSESEPTPHASSWSRATPSVPVPPISVDIEQFLIKTLGPSGIDFEAEKKLIPISHGGAGPLTVTPVLGNPTKAYPEMYVPGEEELSEDEMRLSFCGTGMPYVTFAQASACLIVQTGDGKSYLFDIGTASIGRINALEIPGNELTEVFISHTHTDHIGDIDAFWAQAFLSGRTVPIELYGPSGLEHELGTTAFVENFLKTYAWDFETRRGKVDTSGQAFTVYEFDYAETHVIYDQDNFRVTAFPAVHGFDGAVSYRIDWKDLAVVFSGDTDINEFLLENSKNADIIIMETFAPEEYFMESFGWPEGMYKAVGELHVQPEQAGMFFEILQPRFAVSYHFMLDELSTPLIFEGVRKNYDGPYIFSQDLTVINLTPDYIVSRQAEIDQSFVPATISGEMEIKDETKYFMSEWLKDSALHQDDLKEILDERK